MGYYWRQVFSAFYLFSKMFLGIAAGLITFFGSVALFFQGNVLGGIGIAILGLFLFSMIVVWMTDF